MAGRGFGPIKEKSEKTKRNIAERKQAAEKYDEMQDQGMPEFKVFIRIQGKENWLPIGEITVNRSNKIAQAIYEQEVGLVKSSVRAYPFLGKYKDQLEYGYRLKEFDDEPITVAERPSSNPVTSLIEGIKDRFAFAIVK
ncbi:hypothetical protein Pse7367_1149 [Thalassoporum mexicanum PCC 7367]|uniref:HHL1-like protein n=1 Tax=Thalassoporum mexicanum TaxID=3457544 RepID=UPI00029FC96A|nr:HHL1-like protein [Pseudanabaena sp. PCC 7367]AFY69446.1 hypothetical protein Pse7367_1149 [Pseudanabaena sp. PCC 7367]